MNRVTDALFRICGDLDDLGCAWALVGGLAVSARAEPRTTRDVDVAVAVTDDEEAESLVHDLGTREYSVVASVEQTNTKRLATVRLRRGERLAPQVLVDLLFASSGIEPEVVAAATRIEVLPDLVVPVATIGHLLALKVLARDDRERPTDWDDIRALLSETGPQDIEQARVAVRLIHERGFGRGRAMAEELERAITELADSEA